MANLPTRSDMTVEKAMQDAEEAKEKIQQLSRIENDARAYLNSRNDYILSSEEAEFSTRLDEFIELKNLLEMQSNEIIAYSRRCESRYVAKEIKTRLQEIKESSLVMCRKARELEIFLESVLRVIPDQEIINIFMKISTGFRGILGNALALLQSMEVRNNQQISETNLSGWATAAGKLHFSISEAAMKIPSLGLGMEQLDRIKNLLVRLRTKHTPDWYYELADVVGGGILDEIRTFEGRLKAYVAELDQIAVEIGDGYYPV